MIHNILIVLQTITALALIVIVMSQTTKHEGLGGAIGGKAQSSFRGKAGLEENLQRFTMYIAVTFFIISIFAAYTY
jgi:protein translocase SecG subunit